MPDIEHTLAQYIGIPFKDHGRDRNGCDCWGLVKLVLKEQMGLASPDLGEYYSTAYDRQSVDGLLHTNSNTGWNYDVTGETRKPLDILIFTRAGVETHVGLHVSQGVMLHIMEGIDSCFERYDAMRWARRLSRVARPTSPNSTTVNCV